MIGRFRIDLAGFHDFFPRNTCWILKPIHVPTLEKGQIEGNVGRVEVGIIIDFIEKTSEVFDIIHCMSIKMIVLRIKTFILQSQTSQVPLQLLSVVFILFIEHFF